MSTAGDVTSPLREALLQHHHPSTPPLLPILRIDDCQRKTRACSTPTKSRALSSSPTLDAESQGHIGGNGIRRNQSVSQESYFSSSSGRRGRAYSFARGPIEFTLWSRGDKSTDTQRAKGIGERGGDDELGVWDRQRIYWSIFTMNAGAIWAYQAIIQAQGYYHARFPNANLEFAIMVATTLPMLLGHSMQLLTGCDQMLGFSVRIYAAYVVYVVVGFVVIAQDLMPISEGAHVATVLTCAAIIGATNTISESPLYGLAGIFPHGFAPQAMNAGNGFAGIIVVGVNALSMLVTGGGQSVDDLRRAMYIFFGVQMCFSLLCIGIYWKLRRLPACERHVATSREASRVEHERNGTSHSDRHGQLCRLALRLWKPMLAQFATFFVSLMLWPGVPCSAHRTGPFKDLSFWYCSPLVIFVFNAFDLLGRILAGHAGVQRCFTLDRILSSVALRTLLIPVVFYTARPGPDAWAGTTGLLLFTLTLIGLSNGLLTTLGMMRGPAMVGPHERELAAYLMVLALYAGLSFGSMGAYIIEINT